MNPATDRRRRVVDLSRGGDLGDLRGEYHRDPVAEGYRFGLIVGDVHGRRGHWLCRASISSRILGQHRPSERDPLALATGQHVGSTVEQSVEAEHGSDVGDQPLLAGPLRDPDSSAMASPAAAASAQRGTDGCS